MNGMPRNGSMEMILARSLNNQALAQRISMLQHNRRAFDKRQADAYLEEAARRLQWLTAYEAGTYVDSDGTFTEDDQGNWHRVEGEVVIRP